MIYLSRSPPAAGPAAARRNQYLKTRAVFSLLFPALSFQRPIREDRDRVRPPAPEAARFHHSRILHLPPQPPQPALEMVEMIAPFWARLEIRSGVSESNGFRAYFFAGEVGLGWGSCGENI